MLLTARNLVICRCSFNTLTGLILSDFEVLDVLKFMFTFARASEL